MRKKDLEEELAQAQARIDELATEMLALERRERDSAGRLLDHTCSVSGALFGALLQEVARRLPQAIEDTKSDAARTWTLVQVSKALKQL